VTEVAVVPQQRAVGRVAVEPRERTSAVDPLLRQRARPHALADSTVLATDEMNLAHAPS
jgi:hypothetical protein